MEENNNGLFQIEKKNQKQNKNKNKQKTLP